MSDSAFLQEEKNKNVAQNVWGQIKDVWSTRDKGMAGASDSPWLIKQCAFISKVCSTKQDASKAFNKITMHQYGTGPYWCGTGHG